MCFNSLFAAVFGTHWHCCTVNGDSTSTNSPADSSWFGGSAEVCWSCGGCSH